MRTRKTAGQRREEILHVTMRLAEEIGPDRLSVQAIADEVGLTQPGIFRHFPTKKALWEAVAGEIAARMEAGWAAVCESTGDPLDRVTGLIAAQLHLIQTTPAIPAILFSRELHAGNDELRQAVLGLMGRYHDALTAALTAAQRAGQVVPDVDPGDAGFVLLSLVQGLAVRWSLSGRIFSLTEEGQRLLALQLRAFLPPE